MPRVLKIPQSLPGLAAASGGTLVVPPPTRSTLGEEKAQEWHVQDQHLWGLVLAGGDGKRLQPLVRSRFGEDRPKQYCTFFGKSSLLRQTLRRAEQLIPPERLLTVITQAHLRYAQEELADRCADTVIVQPYNRDTGAGILLPLLHIFQRDPAALVALFPSDHFILEEARFMAAVQTAVACLSRHPLYLVLLGVDPLGPETAYGWIGVGQAMEQLHDNTLYQVRDFWEKPVRFLANLLYQRRYPWNTMVTVARVSVLLELFQTLTPMLYEPFCRCCEVLGSPQEWPLLQEIYTTLPRINFSHTILGQSVYRLGVLRVQDVHWSDWGESQRVLHDLAYYELT